MRRGGRAASSVRSITAGMPRNGSRPVEEGVDGDLVGGVEHARRGAAGDGGLAGQAQAGERVGVDAARRSASRPRRGRAARHRHVDALGVVQRVGDRRRACPGGRGARAPRRRTSRTSEWTIDCGCTTTSIRSYGVPNRWWASMTSRPLFMSVAESIVILPPIAHVGCASASSTVTPASSPRRAAAERAADGGDDEPVDRARPARRR